MDKEIEEILSNNIKDPIQLMKVLGTLKGLEFRSQIVTEMTANNLELAKQIMKLEDENKVLKDAMKVIDTNFTLGEFGFMVPDYDDGFQDIWDLEEDEIETLKKALEMIKE